MTTEELTKANELSQRWRKWERFQKTFREEADDAKAVKWLLCGDMMDISHTEFEADAKTVKQIREILDDALDMKRAEAKVAFESL